MKVCKVCKPKAEVRPATNIVTQLGTRAQIQRRRDAEENNGEQSLRQKLEPLQREIRRLNNQIKSNNTPATTIPGLKNRINQLKINAAEIRRTSHRLIDKAVRYRKEWDFDAAGEIQLAKRGGKPYKTVWQRDISAAKLILYKGKNRFSFISYNLS